jgi:hypothetical protein
MRSGRGRWKSDNSWPVASIGRDPAGIVERVPELAALAERDAPLRRAIERGRPHAIYRRLFVMRWFGGARGDRGLLDTLLRQRRLFLEPIRGVPPLFTLNGVGLTVYGDSDRDPNDGTHIKTLFAVLVFVPIFPFTSYLVVQSATRARAWSFIGKVPPGPLTWAWSRLLALAAIAIVAYGALGAVSAARYNQVHLVNELPVPVSVALGSLAPVDVPAGQRKTVTAAVGSQPIVVKSGGRVVEAGTMDVKRGAGALIWNVLGAGLVYREAVHYAAAQSQQKSTLKPTIWCGQSAIVVDDSISDLFATPPARLTTSSAVVTRDHVDVFPRSEASCTGYLSSEGRFADGARLAAAVAEATDFDVESTQHAVTLFGRAGDPKQAEQLVARAVKAHDGSIDLHRLQQAVLLQDGHRAETLEMYHRRADAQPDSADAVYLYARLLPRADGLPAARQALKRFPRHAYLLRSLAFQAAQAGDYREAAAAAARLHEIDRKLWSETARVHAAALVATGRLDEARALVRGEVIGRPAEGDVEELVTVGLQLAALPPSEPQETLLAALGDPDEARVKIRRLWVRIAAGTEAAQHDLDALPEDGWARPTMALALLARADPRAALAQLDKESEIMSTQLPLPVWTLLFAEAVRADEKRPALAALERGSAIGGEVIEAAKRYVRTGELSPELDDLPLEMLAALHFVRSRAVGPGDERAQLEKRARREEVLHGPVFHALTAWPR